MTTDEQPMTASDWRALARLAYATAEALRPDRTDAAERFEHLGDKCAHRCEALTEGRVVP